MRAWIRASLGAVVLTFAAMSCTGDRGPAGPAGQQGEQGQPGQPGQPGTPGPSTGTVSGTLTDAVRTTNVSGATVTFSPGGISATSDANGAYTAMLPPGIYDAKVTATGYADKTVAEIAVLAGMSITKDVSLDPTNPLIVNAGPTQWQAGFGTTVTLDGSGSSAGGEAGTLTYEWTQVSGPTVSLNSPASATTTFTTKTLQQLIADNDTQFRVPNRLTVLGFTGRDVAEMSYTFRLKVTLGQFEKTAQVVVQSIARHGGLDNVPVNVASRLTSPTQGAYAWTCVKCTDGTCAASNPCAAGVLTDETTQTPSFRPTEEGAYQVTETTAGTLTLFAGIFIGARTAGTDRTRCQGCHDNTFTVGGRTITNKFTPWSKTKHATYFKRQIDGTMSAGYNQSCIKCHTVGYNPDAANGGFDDVAAAEGWTFPTTLQAGNWDAMPPKLQSVASIGCESCHGPGSQHATFTAVASIGKSYNAVDCNQCHANEPYQVQGIQWANSAHATFPVSGLVTPATDDPALRGSCSSCHATQGFVEWARNGVSSPPAPSPDVAEPQTCATCHDPHGEATLADGVTPTPHQLRIYGKVLTVNGLGADNVGAGALCMTCHNSRRQVNITSQRAPHGPAQADVFLGKNAYDFGMGSYPVSPHTTVENTCAGCHMAPTPASGPGRHKVGGHSFAVKADNIENVAACTGCHEGLSTFNRTAYGDFDGDGTVEGIQDEVRGLLEVLKQALATRAAQLWPMETCCVETAGACPGECTGGTGAFVGSSHGRMALFRDYVSGVSPADCDPSHEDHPSTCYSFSAGSIPVNMDDGKNFVGAAWNMLLASNDGSKGVHNPAFVVSMLQRAYRALTGNDVPGATIRR